VTPFRPHPLLAGGHRQTLVGYWLRRSLRWEVAAEDVLVEAEPDVRLLLRASWQPEPGRCPTLLLVHGLGGCDRATYGIATGALAWEAGWNVVRMNMRGAGDAEALCARLYHAGLDQDLIAVLGTLAARTPRLALAGFSLGGNLALLALARRREALPPGLFAAAAVSPPLDLAACAAALERPVNRPYQRHYMRNLREAYRARQRRLPDLYAPDRERDLRTVRAYDDAITAPYGGFAGVDDYYARSSAGPHLREIDRPTLILSAQDDPLVPGESVARWPLPASGVVRREMTDTGGHVGFVAPTTARGSFWAGERILSFLTEAAAGTKRPPARLDGADPAA
jgi:predicted alpha/beta-fold hydrolase